MLYKYKKLDSKKLQIDSDELMDELSSGVLQFGDLEYALQRVLNYGVQKDDTTLSGLQDLIKRLREMKNEILKNYDLKSPFARWERRLNDIIEREKQALRKQFEELKKKYDKEPILDKAKKIKEEKESFLENLGQTFSQKLENLKTYKFSDQGAKEEFDKLLSEITEEILSSLFKEAKQKIIDEKERFKEMLDQLNSLMREKIDGKEPNFKDFSERFKDLLGEEFKNFDDFIKTIQKRAGMLNSILQSLPPQKRREIERTFDLSILGEDFQKSLKEFKTNLNHLAPIRDYTKSYPFVGKTSLPFKELLDKMETLQKIEELERTLRNASWQADLREVNEKLVREVMGETIYKEFEELKKIEDELKRAGYIDRSKKGLFLTPKGIRKIGQKALKEIFSSLSKDLFGRHSLEVKGKSGRMLYSTKKYEYGDRFFLDIKTTVMNAVKRCGPKIPVKFKQNDFEVYEMEKTSKASTVLLIDLSYSMVWSGNFLAAKKVAIALHTLISTKFPRDDLYIVGFYGYAREIKPRDLPFITWDWWAPYTNIQEGLRVSTRLLSKHQGSNRQIILISDGEPTAHIENNGRLFFQYPPSPQTIKATIREVKRVTKAGIKINIFMLERNRSLMEFVKFIAKINKGRVFFTTAESLGEYLIVDYIKNRIYGEHA